MPRVKFSIEKLSDLDERLVAHCNAVIAALVRDCVDHPALEAARKLVLEFRFIPVQDTGEAGVVVCNEVHSEISVTAKTPSRISKKHSFRASRNGHIEFDTDSPDNVNQTTMFNEDE